MNEEETRARLDQLASRSKPSRMAASWWPSPMEHSVTSSTDTQSKPSGLKDRTKDSKRKRDGLDSRTNSTSNVASTTPGHTTQQENQRNWHDVGSRSQDPSPAAKRNKPTPPTDPEVPHGTSSPVRAGKSSNTSTSTTGMFIVPKQGMTCDIAKARLDYELSKLQKSPPARELTNVKLAIEAYFWGSSWDKATSFNMHPRYLILQRQTNTYVEGKSERPPHTEYIAARLVSPNLAIPSLMLKLANGPAADDQLVPYFHGTVYSASSVAAQDVFEALDQPGVHQSVSERIDTMVKNSMRRLEAKQTPGRDEQLGKSNNHVQKATSSAKLSTRTRPRTRPLGTPYPGPLGLPTIKKP